MYDKIHYKKKKKSVVDNIVVRMKVKEIYNHITHGQKHDKPFFS